MEQSSQSIRVDIVSDVVCPWCVIGYHQLEKASKETGIPLEIYWHPFELNPAMAEEGENLREHLAAKYGTTLEESINARERLTALGASLGFTFNYADDMRMWNTFRAHQLIDWAEARGRGHAATQALFSVFFTDRENVSDPAVLAEVANRIGLDGTAALAMLESGEQAEMVREKQRFWTDRGIRGVPAMIFQRKYLVSGAQGEATYASILTQLSEAAASPA